MKPKENIIFWTIFSFERKIIINFHGFMFYRIRIEYLNIYI